MSELQLIVSWDEGGVEYFDIEAEDSLRPDEMDRHLSVVRDDKVVAQFSYPRAWKLVAKETF